MGCTPPRTREKRQSRFTGEGNLRSLEGNKSKKKKNKTERDDKERGEWEKNYQGKKGWESQVTEKRILLDRKGEPSIAPGDRPSMGNKKRKQ